MSITATTRLCTATIAAILTAVSTAAIAQDRPPARMLLVAEDGTELEYTTGDASFYIASSVSNEEETASATELSLSLSTITPVDAALLNWSAQTGSKSKQDYTVVITSSVSDASGEEREIRYEIEDATVTSLSSSVSTYAEPSISVSLTGGKLIIDGVAVN